MKGKAGRVYWLTEKGKRYFEAAEKYLKELAEIEKSLFQKKTRRRNNEM